MNNKITQLIPDLRFPEFVDDAPWKQKELGEFLDYIQPTNYLVNSTSYDDSYETPVLTAGKTFILGYTDETTGIFAENLPIIIFDDFTTAVQYVDFPFKAKSSAMKILLPKGDASIKFFYESIQNINYISGAHQRHWISIFSKIKVPVPKNYLEQQKIASCLSSLDELITVQKEKLELLKNHKKGLMQNLFPQEGETVPKFRFPEFENESDWEVIKLGEIAQNLDSKRIPITANQREKGNVPYYGASGIIDFVKDYIYNDNLLCISEDGANLIDRNYPIAFPIKGKTWVNNHAHVLKFESLKTQLLVCTYINSINVEDFLTGAAQPKLNRAKLDIIPIPLPQNKNEQEKIASCLFSLDELISSQTGKIEKLQLHKKGLMQGLFPKMID